VVEVVGSEEVCSLESTTVSGMAGEGATTSSGAGMAVGVVCKTGVAELEGSLL